MDFDFTDLERSIEDFQVPTDTSSDMFEHAPMRLEQPDLSNDWEMSPGNLESMLNRQPDSPWYVYMLTGLMLTLHPWTRTWMTYRMPTHALDPDIEDMPHDMRALNPDIGTA